MHDDTDDREEARRESVEAADDTGMVREQAILVQTELALPVEDDDGR